MTRFNRLILRLLPRRLRERHGSDLIDLYKDMYPTAGRFQRFRFCSRVLGDVLITSVTAAVAGSRDVLRGARGSTLSFSQDFRFAFRTLRKRPLFAIVAVLTLSAGIGATTAMFSVVEGVLLRPLPYERPEELVHIWQTYPEWRTHGQLAARWNRNEVSYPDFRRLHERQTVFDDVALYGYTTTTLTGLDTPERVYAGIASPSLFSLLGFHPELGRFFLPEEVGRGAPRVAILSFEFWAERFGSDPNVLGRTITLNGMAFDVVGVLPADFRLRNLEEYAAGGTRPFWIPVGANGATLGPEDHSFEAVARMKPGVTIDQATEQTDVLIRGDRELSAKGAWLVPRAEAESFGFEAPLMLLLAASFVLLLIACGNLSLLILGEVTSRRHEFATRAALGAGRMRVVRQLLTESALLGVLASLIGAFLAIGGTRFLMTLAPPLPRIEGVGVNGTVLSFTIVVGLVTGAVFGVLPSLGLSFEAIHEMLQRRKNNLERGESFSQRLIVSLEIALTVVLLVSCGLLIRSLGNILGTDLGFHREYMAEVRVELPAHRNSRYSDPQARLSTLEEIRSTLAAVPGVANVSGSSTMPLTGIPSFYELKIEGWDSQEDGSTPHAFMPSVFPGFLEAMGVPLVAGRMLSDSDTRNTLPVAVISESMARRFWPPGAALGSEFCRGPRSFNVVGIVGDVRYESMNAEVRPTAYVSALQFTSSRLSFVLKTQVEPESLFPQLRDAVWSIAADAPITRTTTISALISESAREERFRTVVIVLFSICAALLAASGIFGVTARSVTRRYREFGIRVALGARERRLVRSTVGGTLLTGLIGTALGLLSAFWVSRLLRDFLFGVSPSDPLIYGLVGALTTAICLAAAYVPARRVMSVDPVEVLKAE